MDQPPGDGVYAGTTPYVGKYRIVEEVGRGGMGVVYRAVDEQLRREVALKSPLPTHASAADRHRLLREARAASRVSHPQIVPIYEVFEADDRPWIAMELVVGETLRAALRTRGRLPVEDVLLLGEQLAEALDAAHAGGVLHGDLNPNNVMLTPRGGARLMDFGLSRLMAAAQDLLDDVSTVALSGSKAWGGTLGYISPEQILGRPLVASSDLFSLGAVLYEASTGRRPFKGGAPGEILDATLHTQPSRPSQLRGDLPWELDRIIVKALSRRADERYQSAREMLADLRALRRRVVAAQDQPDVIGIRSRTRQKVVAAMVIGLIAVLTAPSARCRLAASRAKMIHGGSPISTAPTTWSR